MAYPEKLVRRDRTLIAHLKSLDVMPSELAAIESGLARVAAAAKFAIDQAQVDAQRVEVLEERYADIHVAYEDPYTDGRAQLFKLRVLADYTKDGHVAWIRSGWPKARNLMLRGARNRRRADG